MSAEHVRQCHRFRRMVHRYLHLADFLDVDRYTRKTSVHLPYLVGGLQTRFFAGAAKVNIHLNKTIGVETTLCDIRVPVSQ